MKALLSALVLLCLVVSSGAHAYSTSAGDGDLKSAIVYLASKAFRHDGAGAGVREISQTLVTGGFTQAGIGASLRYFESGAPKLESFLIRWGARVALVGYAGTSLGVIISVLEPSPAHASTLADSFKSPEGLNRFFKLTPEQQYQVAYGDREFSDFLKVSATKLQQLEANAAAQQ